MKDTIVMPFWMWIVFGPGILWIIVSSFLGALVTWKFIFSNSSENVQKHDRKRAVLKTWLTVFLCNLLSCVALLIIEFVMRMVVENGVTLSSLVIWDSPATIFVYMIPVVISFFVISAQIRRRNRYLIADRIPARIASWVMAVLYTPWFILIPSSVVWNLTDIIN